MSRTPEAIEDAVLQAVTTAADAGLPCPTNPELSALTGGSPSLPVRILYRLAARGLIAIARFQAGRRVTIIATGQSTAYSGKVSPHWRDLAADASDQQPAEVLTGQRLAQIIRRVAAERGVTLSALLAPARLTGSIIGNLTLAKAPKPATIAKLIPILGDALGGFDLPTVATATLAPAPTLAGEIATEAARLARRRAAARCIGGGTRGSLAALDGAKVATPTGHAPCGTCGARDATACGCGRPATRIAAAAQPNAVIPPRPQGRPRTFEEQLAAVAAGAGLIEVQPLRRAAPDQTLGGVGSGWL